MDQHHRDSTAEKVVLLCSGCAGELDDEHKRAVQVADLDGSDMGCSHCGAILVGYGYVVPQSAYTGMAPDAG